MKKLFSMLVLATSLMIGSYAHAISIPVAEDAKGGPAPWLVPVYNNSGSSLAAGSVVVWQIASSTGADDNYVTTTTTADTAIVAGVVYKNAIAAGDTGVIAVHGVVPVTVGFGGNTVGGLLCSSSVAGSARTCANDDAGFGIVTTAASAGSGYVFINKLN